MVRLILILSLLSVGSCYSPSFDSCGVRCGAADACPAGLTCNNGYCQRPHEPATCGQTIDGGDDGAMFDSSIDAAFDATGDDGGTSSLRLQVISAGDEHTCGIDDSGQAGAGRLYCWGLNRIGALGIESGAVFRSGTPRLVDANDDWVRVSAGTDYTCGIRGTDLYCWGYNGLLQLGDPTKTQDPQVASPNPVMAGTAFVEVATGGSSTCAIDSTQQLWCWGDNNFSVPTRGMSTSPSATPMPINLGDAPSNSFKSISIDILHACAIHTGGELYCWGAAGNGRLGNGVTGGNQPTPVLVDSPENDWASVATGRSHTCAVTTGGKLYCWGSNTLGQGGFATAGDRVMPLQVGTGVDWSAVHSSRETTCAVRAGAVYCAGDNRAGQLGVGDFRESSFQFVPVVDASGITAVTVGDQHACMRSSGGTASCWGSNGNGQLGEGTIANALEPTRIGSASWKQVSSGSAHTCAIDLADRAWCWGRGDRDQLGQASSVVGLTAPTPVQVDTTTAWSEIAAGGLHACGRKAGELWCWGDNTYNQVGLTTGALHPPQRIGARTDWASLAMGTTASCGVLTDGARHCWGASPLHQLGNGSTATVLTPTAVADGVTWSQVSLGERFGCGVATGGQLSCWGDRAHGAVGDGVISVSPAASPVAIGTGYGKVAASPDTGHACAISAGALGCWGFNQAGQLGQNDQTERDAPTPVGSDDDWTWIGVGGEHTCGLRGQLLQCWGWNADGRVGDGTIDWRTAPGSPVAGSLAWKALSVGERHNCGITTNDFLYCWGDNTFGQLGLGMSARLAPVAVIAP